MTIERKMLVLGATGDIGGEAARQLRDAGWSVRAMKRGLARSMEEQDGMVRVRGDALVPADVATAAEGCEAIVHAVNPPGYRRWGELVLPMLESTLAAAARTNATVVLPGTVYNFGPDALPLLTEGAPQRPMTEKGRIRVAMEQRLADYAARGGRVIIVRAGDFFGPRSKNSWFSQGLIAPGKPVRTIRNPGPGVGHTWSYLPDLARTMVLLLDRRHSLDAFAVFHMAGHWDADGTAMAEAIRRVVSRHCRKAPRIGAFPWWLIRMAAPFHETMREIVRMRYLWQQPIAMDNSKLMATLGEEPHTPLDTAVEATLLGLGCLPARPRVEKTPKTDTLCAKVS